MKKLAYIFLILTIFGCSSYPEEPPYLVSKDHFIKQEVKKAAPYLYPKNEPRENGYATYNLPPNIKDKKTYKDWDIITEKYKADLFYFINKKGSDTYIYRHITKWHHQNQEITKPAQFYELLKREGYTNYKILDTASMEFHRPYYKMYLILLDYNGVKHQVKLNRSEIYVTSYPKSQQVYWESQGVFMLDTTDAIREKWIKENK